MFTKVDTFFGKNRKSVYKSRQCGKVEISYKSKAFKIKAFQNPKILARKLHSQKYEKPVKALKTIFNGGSLRKGIFEKY